jgi:hypothetical protein
VLLHLLRCMEPMLASIRSSELPDCCTPVGRCSRRSAIIVLVFSRR